MSGRRFASVAGVRVLQGARLAEGAEALLEVQPEHRGHVVGHPGGALLEGGRLGERGDRALHRGHGAHAGADDRQVAVDAVDDAGLGRERQAPALHAARERHGLPLGDRGVGLERLDQRGDPDPQLVEGLLRLGPVVHLQREGGARRGARRHDEGVLLLGERREVVERDPEELRQLAGEALELALLLVAEAPLHLLEDLGQGPGEVAEADVRQRVGGDRLGQGGAELGRDVVRRAHDHALQAGALGLRGDRRRHDGVAEVGEAELVGLRPGGLARLLHEGAEVEVRLAEDVGRQLGEGTGELVRARQRLVAARLVGVECGEDLLLRVREDQRLDR